MRRRVIVVAVALVVAAGWFVVTAPAGGAAGNLETAWWWQGEATTGAVPPPPTVPDGGLWVSSNASGPQSVSAVRVALSPGETASTLVLDVHQAVPPTAFDVSAYPTTAAWAPGPAQAWTSKPAYDANGVHATGSVSTDGMHVTFDVSGLATGDQLSVVIAPSPAAAPPPAPLPAPPPGPPTFDVTFEKPGPANLQVATELILPPDETASAAAAATPAAATDDVAAAPVQSFESPVPAGLTAPLPAVATAPPAGATPPVAFNNAGRPFTRASVKRAAGDTAVIAVMLGIVLLWLARDTAASSAGTRRARLSLYDAPTPAEAMAVPRAGTPPPLR